MKQSKKNAFTLIELIATLVIMAIIALIATPLVMNIIRKARISADKRSVDAYGRSIELAIAGYLLDTGKFPTSVEQLTIEYSGNKVVCTTTQLNSDSSVYLAGCTVAGRSTEDYTYGKEEVMTYDSYSVGNQVTYNNVDYYVIKDSGAKESTVTLLKVEPLTTIEVNKYGTGHVNMYNCSEDEDCYQTASDRNGYGGMAYYTSTTCNSSGDKSGCTVDYEQSEIKCVVDAWKAEKAPAASEARLIAVDEIETESKEFDCCGGCGRCVYTANAPKYDWMYNSNYDYWTNTASSDNSLYIVDDYGAFGTTGSTSIFAVVRPVIVLPKSALN